MNNKPWIPTSKQLPPEHERMTVWASFNGPSRPYTRKCVWCYGRFNWPNGGRMNVQPVAWKPYYMPDPYVEEDNHENKSQEVGTCNGKGMHETEGFAGRFRAI